MDEIPAGLMVSDMTQQNLPTKSKGLNYGMVIVGTLILVGLVGLSCPVVLKSAKASDRTEALNNVRQVGMGLVEFDRDYGSFPDDETAREVVKRIKTELKLTGEFSNDYFRSSSRSA